MLLNFSILSAALAIAYTVATSFAAPLEIRAPPPPLVSHLKGPATFYRAVHHGEELTNVKSIYVVGHSPKPRTSGTPIAGDLGLGALYVYADKMETYNHGNGWCQARMNPPNPNVWYLITFQYTPSASIKPLSFLTPDAAWKKFVQDNNAGRSSANPAPIVEAPVTHGSAKAAVVDNQYLYQAGFIGAGLSTLKVTAVTTMQVEPKPAKHRSCCEGCIAM